MIAQRLPIWAIWSVVSLLICQLQQSIAASIEFGGRILPFLVDLFRRFDPMRRRPGIRSSASGCDVRAAESLAWADPEGGVAQTPIKNKNKKWAFISRSPTTRGSWLLDGQTVNVSICSHGNGWSAKSAGMGICLANEVECCVAKGTDRLSHAVWCMAARSGFRLAHRRRRRFGG